MSAEGPMSAIPTYKVTALRMGTLGADRSALVHGVEPGVGLDVPVFAAAIEGDGRRILVDTGIGDPGWVRANLGQSCEQTPEETLPGALDGIGWRPGEVDIVVNTHLHYDHVGWNHLFPGKGIVVSKVEWEAAAAPIGPQQTALYSPRDWLAPPLTPFDYSIVSADYHDIAPGVRLIATPGHSLGHRSVLVNTRAGVLCVVGDAVNVADNFTMATPGGIHVSIADAIASMERIAREADAVLMAHDPRIEANQDEGFPAPGSPS
jgi:glyoxylase-like metal-dependent hydrolase (beta-lactamase superfamily II)